MVDLNNLSPQITKDFYKALGKRFKVKFIDSSSWIYRIVKLLLDRILSKYAAKLDAMDKIKSLFDDIDMRPCCLGKYIVLPYKIGNNERSKQAQVLIAVHECEHAIRLRNYPGSTVNWYAKYFADPMFRALEEGPPQSVAAEVLYAMGGSYRDLDLRRYFCTNEAKATAALAYNQRRATVIDRGRGTATSSVSAFAIKWLKGGPS